MTIGTLQMPRLGETMDEGRLVEWLIKPGETFSRGQEILEVETDKTIVEFPALGDGTLVETLVEIGEVVAVGTPIARIDMGADTPWTSDVDTSENSSRKAGHLEADAEPPVGDLESAANTGTPGGHSGTLRATPVARRMARQRGVELGALKGSGRRGRIERGDVELAAGAADDDRRIVGVTYLEMGPSDGVPMVLLHGFGADHLAWGGVQARLSLAGRRTFSVDLPGHGNTSHDAVRTEDLTGPIDQALNALEIGTAHLVAHSMGAIVGVRLAQTQDVKSLTLIAPFGLGYSIDAEFLWGLANASSSGEISHLLGRVTDGPHGLSPTMLEQIYSDIARRRLVDLADALVGGSGQAVSIRPDLADLAGRMPVHVIVGHRDRILDWREALDVSPRIAIHHLPRAGHSPHWEALSEVAAIITDITA